MSTRFAPRAVLTGFLAFAAACASPQEAAREHVSRGDSYMKDGKVQEALLQYRNAVQKDEMFPEGRQKLAAAYEQSGNLKAALGQYVRAADLLPNDAAAQVKAGQFLLRARQYQDAGARADRALAIDASHVDAHVLKGNASAGLRDLDAAVDELQEAISIDPRRTASYANLGALEAARGRHDQAEEAFLKAVSVAPNEVGPKLALANYYWAVNRAKEAEEQLELVTRLDARNIPAHRAMAMIRMAAGDAAGAERHLKTVVDSSGDRPSRLALADFYMSQKRQDEARPILQALRQEPEGFVEAATRLAALEYTKGDRARGHQLLDEVLAKEPSNVMVKFLKGTWQLAEGQSDAALQTAQDLLKTSPDAVHGHQLAGQAHMARSEVDEAIAAFQEVVKINPKAVGAQLQLARLHEAKGGHATARQHAQDAVKLAPQSGAARYSLVRSLIASGDASAAERELAPLAKSSPNAYEVQLALGRIAFLRKNTAAAQAAFEKALAVQPDGVEAVTAMTAIELRSGRLARAQAIVDKALAMRPGDPALTVLSARVELTTGQFTTGEEKLRALIARMPDYLPAYETLGQAYARRNNLDAARQEYERLAEKAPRAVGPHTMVGMLHQVQGHEQDAVKSYRRVLDLDSRAVVANNNLAYFYAEKEQELDLALQMAQTAKAGRPDDPDVNDTLGWVYYKKGMPAQAVGPLLQAIRINPANPLYHYHLGLAYQKNGDREKAAAALKQALSLGTFAEADAARKALERVQ